MRKSKLENERKAIYFDLMCGLVSSIISISGILFSAIKVEIYNMGWFTTGLTFWLCYLLFAGIMIFVGLRGHYQIKKYGLVKSKKPLKAPIA
ncbi:MAG: hypothetical protein ACW986_10305 [Promethearchaeota archaeon]